MSDVGSPLKLSGRGVNRVERMWATARRTEVRGVEPSGCRKVDGGV